MLDRSLTQSDAAHERQRLHQLRLRERSPEERKAAAERNMRLVDAMPREWRLLVHEYGLLRVFPLYRDRVPYEQAHMRLVLPTLDLDL